MATIPQAIATAVKHHQAGRLQQAERIYRRVLQVDPQQPDALHLLGVIAYQSGRPDAAVKQIRRALAIRPEDPVYHNNLGSALQALHQFAEAAAHHARAATLDPDYADAHNNWGNALQKQGESARAVRCFQRALQLRPDFPEAHNNLGSVLQQQGQRDDAVASYRRALQLRPDYAEAHSNLGSALRSQGNLDEAVASYRLALQGKPDAPEVRGNLGNTLQAQGKLDEAIACYEEALRSGPESAEVYNNLAGALTVAGRLEEAVRTYEQALRVDPDFATAYAQLGTFAAKGAYRFREDQLARIRSRLADPRIRPGDAAQMHFTLASVLDREQAYDEAFEHYRQANELRREVLQHGGIEFDLPHRRELVDAIIEVFSRGYFEDVGERGVDCELPVFVVGMARSGTTLVEQILASHPRMFGAGELTEIGQIAAALARSTGGRDEHPRCMLSIDPAAVRSAAENHLQHLRFLGGDAERVVDKMPANFHHLGLIATLFPRAGRPLPARSAHTCLSSYFQNYESEHAASLSCRLDTLGACYRLYDRLMTHWHRVLPLPIYDVHYERLVADQETVSRELIAFCGLPWDDRCLEFYDCDRPVRTASKLQVRRPVFATSIGRWQHYRRHLSPLLDALKSPAEGGED